MRTRHRTIGCGQIAANTGQLCRRAGCRGGHPVLTGDTAKINGQRAETEELLAALRSDSDTQVVPAYKRRSPSDHPVTGVRTKSVTAIVGDTSPVFLQQFDIEHISNALADGRLPIHSPQEFATWASQNPPPPKPGDEALPSETDEWESAVEDWLTDGLAATSRASSDLDQVKKDMNAILRAATGSEKGTVAHKHIEDETPLESIDDDDVRGFVSAARSWMESEGITLVDHEVRVWGEDFNGRIDAIARDRDGNLVLVDWKTSLSNKLKVYPSAQAQVAAYTQAEPIPDGWPGGEVPRKAYVVKIGANSEYFPAEVDCAPDSPAIRTWEAMKELAYTQQALTAVGE